MAAELAFDVEIDNAIFAGISGVTRALHVCRGNNAGWRWVASQYVPMERLALSPQCGFASVEADNPLTPADQEAKLRLVRQIARRVWRA